MIKCSKCKADSAGHTVSVRTCPKCGRVVESRQFVRLLKTLGLGKITIKKIRKELATAKVGTLLK
ncbi:MAG: hypothetical protein WCC63_03450 [Candidatus Bathyarchaeia archaeon]